MSKKVTNLLKDYYRHRFDDFGSIVSEDYTKFQKKYKSVIKDVAEKISMELVEFVQGHYEFSAVLKAKETPHYFQIAIKDVRYWPDRWADEVQIGHYNPDNKKVEMRSWVRVDELKEELADLHQWYLR